MENDFIEQIIKQLSLEHDEVNKYSPLTLAYLGDCVYEIIIRTMLVYEGNSTVNKLHERASRLVKAKSLSDIIRLLEADLTEEALSC